MERRELLKWLVATTGLHSLDALAPSDLLALARGVHREAAGDSHALRVLSPAQERTVAAAAERIIPATDTPGATDANVSQFVDRMLADWHTAAERERLMAGLPELDARCRARRGMDFVSCSEADQVAVLTALDEEVTALRASEGAGAANQHWFGMLKYLTIFGFCTSEVGQRDALQLWPPPGRYDGCAPLAPATTGSPS
jgi:gluconate 2-dehydrogenase gamma chain